MYVQRYVPHLPAAGEIVIFDRSWYNRAGVERVMGLCTEEEAEEFLKAVPLVEQAVVDSGVILLKYWLEVSPDEQTRRLKQRIRDGRKIWKLSDMDLKSYSRWFDYSRARDEMFAASDTGFAPWFVVRSDDKKRARLNLIPHLLEPDPVRGGPTQAGQAAQAPETARVSRAEISVQVRRRALLSRHSRRPVRTRHEVYAAARPVQRKRQRVVAHDGTVELSPSATNADEYRTGIVGNPDRQGRPDVPDLARRAEVHLHGGGQEIGSGLPIADHFFVRTGTPRTRA